jgi:serine/threonine protein kinase
MEYKGQRLVFDSPGVRLGAGGMAEVYLATRRDDPSQYVAIKVPRSDLGDSERALFLREAEAAGRVVDPHVVAVVDWGDIPPFIAFEFVQGITLAKELRNRQTETRRWSEAELIGMYRQLVDAMTAINQQVIHRDLKPDNIFLDGDLLRVTDFGIAKYVGQVTRSRSFKGWGTLAYMAPETLRWESIEWLADQYSLGVVFYELATLRQPFTGSPDELEHQHLFVRPPRITAVSPSLSERLATVVARMLAKRREDRYSSWQAVADELDAVQKDLPAERAQPVVEDSIIRVAAQQIELVRSQELEQQRQEKERRRREQERRDLLNFWADDFFARVRAPVEQLNRSLGDVIQLSEPPAGTRAAIRECSVSFIKANLRLTLQVVPLEGPEDIPLWGTVQLHTNRRGWFGNIYLKSAPPPYGEWVEVDMRMGAFARRASPEEEDRTGGQYEVLGQDRIVLARNWQGIVFQREMRNVMSLVNYSEKPLGFDGVVKECLGILVEDANAEPQKYSQRDRRRRF